MAITYVLVSHGFRFPVQQRRAAGRDRQAARSYTVMYLDRSNIVDYCVSLWLLQLHEFDRENGVYDIIPASEFCVRSYLHTNKKPFKNLKPLKPKELKT